MHSKVDSDVCASVGHLTVGQVRRQPTMPRYMLCGLFQVDSVLHRMQLECAAAVL